MSRPDFPPALEAAIDWIADLSTTVPGWRSGAESRALTGHCLRLAPDPVIVEVGAFMGRSTVMMAAARRLAGSGRIHCVDPFDGSGDAFSTPHYRRLLERSGRSSIEEAFRQNLRRFRVEGLVTVHKATSVEAAGRWTAPIDLLLLDADHSPDGARAVFEAWTPFLKDGALLVLDNTAERAYAPGHDGNFRIARERLAPPAFREVIRIMGTTFARRASPRHGAASA